MPKYRKRNTKLKVTRDNLVYNTGKMRTTHSYVGFDLVELSQKRQSFRDKRKYILSILFSCEPGLVSLDLDWFSINSWDSIGTSVVWVDKFRAWSAVKKLIWCNEQLSVLNRLIVDLEGRSEESAINV